MFILQKNVFGLFDLRIKMFTPLILHLFNLANFFTNSIPLRPQLLLLFCIKDEDTNDLGTMSFHKRHLTVVPVVDPRIILTSMSVGWSLDDLVFNIKLF